MVLYGLEYAYARQDIREALVIQLSSLYYADVVCSVMNPLENSKTSNGCLGVNDNANQGSGGTVSRQYRIGGLCWSLPDGHKIEDYLLCWVGAENEAFANIVMTFNGCEIVRYDAAANCLVTDVSHQRRILKRRYYLIEKAKDANIVGVLVGTLGVAGYLHMIHQMKELITRAGKKAYTLVMGRPNPAKLANFPECDVFVYVSCPQTALLDSKEFLAPVITPFEAMLAFSRGSQWTGTYVMDFQDLMTSCPVEETQPMEEARFSFLRGGYVEDINLEETMEENEDGTLALAKATEKALWVADKDPRSVVKGSPKSGAEYFAGRSFQGLDIKGAKAMPEPFFIGRTGKASGYEDEKSNQKTG